MSHLSGTEFLPVTGEPQGGRFRIDQRASRPPARAEESTDLLEHLIEQVPHQKAREFLRAFRRLRRVGEAAEAVGISDSTTRYWRGAGRRNQLPGFVEAFDAITHEVNNWWEELAERRAIEGLEDRTYKVEKDGTERLVNRRVREDSSLIKMILGGRMPEKYGRGHTETDITVQIVQVRE